MTQEPFRALTRGCRLPFLLCAALATGACTSGRQENLDRADLFTDIGTQTNRSAPSNVAGQTGQAVYTGAAFADFGAFTGTADASFTADFDTNVLSGQMTDWVDGDALNFTQNGRVTVSGTIADDGSFAGQMSGNIQRVGIGPISRSNPPDNYIFQGSSSGQFYDGINGAPAHTLQGGFQTAAGGSFSVDGDFIASR